MTTMHHTAPSVSPTLRLFLLALLVALFAINPQKCYEAATLLMGWPVHLVAEMQARRVRRPRREASVSGCGAFHAEAEIGGEL